MISLTKYYDTTWEQARGSLRADMDHIEAALNQRWNTMFGDANQLKPGSISGDSTIATRYVANTGVGNTPKWDFVNLTNGATGTLSLGHGGTGNTAFVTGSLIFSDGTKLTEDNANLFWDDANNRLGIGTSAPGTPLHVVTNGTVGIKLSGTSNGQFRSQVQNTSTGVNAFADWQLQCGTVSAFIGVSGQNYSFAGPAAAAKRSWLDTATVLGEGWDYSAPAADGNHIFYTAGYGTTNKRLLIDVNGLTLANNGILDIPRTALGTTSADGAVLENTTAATGVTTVQISPRLRLRGTAWDTAASQTVEFYQEVLPATAATPTGTLRWVYSLNGAAGTLLLSLSSIGNLTMAGNMIAVDYQSTGANGYNVANGAFFYWASRAALSSPADGKVKVSNGAVSAGVLVDVTTDAVFKLRTRADAAYATLDCLGLKASGTAGASFGPAAVTSITVVNGIITAIS